jgi:DNA-binding transcriptional LysR family regulator
MARIASGNNASLGSNMQMHQIRYFLALCEEHNFTRAAKRSGISQPSLTNAISALERELGGALFRRKPLITMTALGYAMQPYMQQIAQTADQALQAARAARAADDVACSPTSSPRNLIEVTDVSELNL